MPKCSFCGRSIERGTGKMFVYNSGKVDNFCSSKCEKNLLKLKRKPLQVRWTEYYRREHKKGVAKVSETSEKEQEKSRKESEKK